MRICLVISEIGPGGAERVLTTLANAFAQNGDTVVLLTFDNGTREPFYSLDERVGHLALGLPVGRSEGLQRVFNNIRRVRLLRKALTQTPCDIVVSFIDRNNATTLLSTFGSGQRVVVCERTHPGMRASGQLWSWMCRLLYPLAARVVVQSDEAAYYYRGLRKPPAVVPNPVLAPPDACSAVQEERQCTVIGMGRFSVEKGFDLLLRAFARVKDRHCGWILVLYGAGPLQGELERVRDGLGLRDCVKMFGITREPYAAFQRSSIFVLPSRFEGFPNALCEAMACGTAVIATACPGGTREIVRPDVDGLLVPADDVEALSAALDRLMSDEGLRRRLGYRAREVAERFSLEKVMDAWTTVFREAMDGATS